jgi:threonylcarbamoyladenosine tRNA methylthiotransferase MtaB
MDGVRQGDGAGCRVHLDFVGCRLNQAEVEAMARRFAARGDAIADDADDADLVVINTCAVTRTAARKSRQIIRQAARANPDAEIVVTGCYTELSPGEVAALPGVVRVVDNAGKDALGDPPPDYEREPLQREALPPGTLGRTRAFVKVQDGCDNRCTFCVTTLARGEGRSRPIDEVVREAEMLAAAGYQEIVLTGVHLGSYGRDLDSGGDLAALVRALLIDTDVSRIRLSSLEPWEIVPGFFDLWSDPRLGAHLHLPLQSGCDATLRRMARRTTRHDFAALLDDARRHIPDLAVTTDVIVGFPGETASEFAESLAFVEEMGFARLHVFPYSSRAGTAAARMPGHISKSEKKARAAQMGDLSDSLWRAFRRRYVGQTLDVLWESARGATPEGFVWSGLTGNYLRVTTTAPRNLANTITAARLVALNGADLRGVLV